MPSLAALTDLLRAWTVPFVAWGSQFAWWTYVGAAGLAAGLLWRRRGRVGSPRAVLRYLLPARLVGHRSTRLDVRLLVVALVVGSLQEPWVAGAVSFVRDAVARGEGLVFGASTALGPNGAASPWVTALSVLATFLAIELGYWLAHLAMHRVAALWEFHKVHHSAQVLTPLTEWRQHPLEWALFPVVIGAVVAAVQGALVTAFGAAAVTAAGGANLILVGFMVSVLHLRHSELPFAATGWLGRLVQSPAHHQIHHSVDPAHYDRNLGFCLSLWDWAFGTLVVPEKGARYRFGLGEEDRALETVGGSLVAPFWRALGMRPSTALRTNEGGTSPLTAPPAGGSGEGTALLGG